MEESNLESWDNLLKLILPILQLLILIIPFLGVRPLFDKSRSYWDRLSKRGYTLCILGIILAILTIKQSQTTNSLDNIKTIKADQKIAKRDSLNQKRNEIENFKTKEMLAKYGLQVDSKNNEIVKMLSDPDQRKTTVIYGESPILDIAYVKIDKETSTKFTFTMTSYDASSYDINVKTDVLAATTDRKVILLRKDIDLFQNNTIIKKDQSIDCFTDIKVAKNYQMLYFRFHGVYKKNDGTIIPVDNFTAYDKRDSERPFGFPKNEVILQIKEYYNKFGL